MNFKRGIVLKVLSLMAATVALFFVCLAFYFISRWSEMLDRYANSMHEKSSVLMSTPVETRKDSAIQSDENTIYTDKDVKDPYKHLGFNVQDFLSTNLVTNPEEANKLSPLLTTQSEVIQEAQRVHMNIFQNLGQYKYAMIFGYIAAINKGDSAIGVGEFILLQKLNITVLFGCAIFKCTKNDLSEAKSISQKYSRHDMVILLQGGGNVIAYNTADYDRAKILDIFPDFHVVLFPQGISYKSTEGHINYCKQLYASHKNLTMLWRDKSSYQLGKKLFPKAQSLLSPDIAFQIGYVPRFMSPTHDILWLRRPDKEESPSYVLPTLPKHLRVVVSDWLKWQTPEGTSTMEGMYLASTNGLTFLQRGRVVITDRLHGHILSTLLDIPHVFIDNKYKKISNYHNTWMANVENMVLANSSSDALIQAEKLLKKLDKHLPKIKGFYKMSV